VTPATTLDVLIAKDEITEALAAYCRAVDRIDMDLGRAVFHDDAIADYGAMFQGTGHGFMDFVRAAHLTMQTHSHHIGGITIRVDGDRAGSECYVIARLRAQSPDGALTDIVSHGRYVDRWERRAGGPWRIAHRRYLHTMDERRPIESASFPTTGSRDPDDPSYAVLREPRGGQ
jgi:ketosteroid isomerase-like protein